MFFRKKQGPGYDAEKVFPAIRSSICTGEKTAGFVDRETGRFTEVMLVRSQRDIDAFCTEYRITEPVKTIY